jgi:hypothetical protein
MWDLWWTKQNRGRSFPSTSVYSHTHALHSLSTIVQHDVQGVERRIVCTPLSVNVFVTLATQQHLKYHCKALFETLCITSESHTEL